LKRVLVVLLAFVILVFALPLLILKGCEKETPHSKKPENFDSMKISVYNVDQNQLQEMNLEEYILGVLAGEMPSAFHIEALKAQALAARTYTLMRTRAFGGAGCSAHTGADVCTDPAHCQAYRRPQNIKANLEKYEQAVLDTKGEIIVYNNALIDAVFHSASGGKTENSEDIWSAKVPYLRSVISEYEEQTKLTSEKEVKIADFIEAMKRLDSGVKLSSKSIKNQIKILDRSEGGRIMDVEVGGRLLTGSAIRGALGLKSANFNISYQGDVMLFKVTGNGHGIGLSQYGADGMGKKGYSYEEIVKHYYQGVEVMRIEDLIQNGQQNTYNAAK
jgi:stage II sporulation protein D